MTDDILRGLRPMIRTRRPPPPPPSVFFEYTIVSVHVGHHDFANIAFVMFCLKNCIWPRTDHEFEYRFGRTSSSQGGGPELEL